MGKTRLYLSFFSLILFIFFGCGKNDLPVEEAECDSMHVNIEEYEQGTFALTDLGENIVRGETGLPLLQSKPEAKVALFLDFDGGTYYGYEDYYGPADLDGNPRAFSEQEAKRIYTAYLHVVEAFDGFDVNVTTREEKARSAEKWAWIIVSDDYSRTGGKGKIGIFNRSKYNYGRPTMATALAGAQAVLNPRYYEIGYLLVHELGHNFGLNHAGRISNGSFEEFSDYSSGPLGAFMGGRAEQFNEYEWMSLFIENGEKQDSQAIIGDITGYSEISSLLGEGEGDCDDSSECQVGLSCVNTNSGLVESFTNKLSGSETCEYLPVDDEDTFLFAEGEGDCDDSSECQIGLTCLNSNGLVESFNNKISGPETCKYLPIDENSSLLAEGEGDCDDSSECQIGLTCLNSNGLIESFNNKISGSETCEYLPIDENNSLLAEGEGDCDDSSECQIGLACMNTNGLIESFNNKISGSETCQVADQTQEIELLKEGEGDCDNSRECAGELVCMNSSTGETEEKDSNDHGFTFKVDFEIDQPGDETCELPENIPEDLDEDIRYAADTLVVKSENKWYFVYCSGQNVKLSRDWAKKQTWIKYGKRNIGVLNGPKLHCPERNGGLSPTQCQCNMKTENYHEKRKSEESHFDTDVAAPASITTNEEIYIGPNNNMNSCLKVVKNKSSNALEIHSPCALEPWKTEQKCSQRADYNLLLNQYADPGNSNKNVHELDCSEFRLNN